MNNYKKNYKNIYNIINYSNKIINLKLESHFPERTIYYLYTPINTTTSTQKRTNKVRTKLSSNHSPPALGEGFTYSSPIIIKENCNIQAIVESDETLIPWNKNFYINKATGKTINLRKRPSNRYNIGGSSTLVDGVVGSTPWTSKEWIGFLGDTLDAVIDLYSKGTEANQLATSSNSAHKSISNSAHNSTLTCNAITSKSDSLTVYFLNAPESWIHLPKSIEVWGSKDGKKFKKIRVLRNKNYTEIQKSTGVFTFKLKPNYRFIRLIGEPLLSIPTGYPGATESAWLFATEIQIK